MAKNKYHSQPPQSDVTEEETVLDSGSEDNQGQVEHEDSQVDVVEETPVVEPVAEDAPAPAPTPSPEVTPEEPVAAAQAPTLAPPPVVADGSAEITSLTSNLETYAETMKPGRPHDAVVGAMYQLDFYRTVRRAIASAEFKQTIPVVMEFFVKEEDKTCSPARIFRFGEQLTASKQEIDGLVALITFVRATSSPATRQAALKQVDFTKLANRISDPAVTNNLVKFFGL